MVEGVSLAPHIPKAVDDLCPGSHSGGLRVVGAVVGHHVDVPEVGWIVLVQDALHQISDDSLLVPGGHHHGEPGGRRRFRVTPALFQGKDRDAGKIDGKHFQYQGQPERDFFHGSIPPWGIISWFNNG